MLPSQSKSKQECSTYCLVVVMERSQSPRQTLWKALLQLLFSQVQSVPLPLLSPSSSSILTSPSQCHIYRNINTFILRIQAHQQGDIAHNKCHIQFVDQFSECLKVHVVEYPIRVQDSQKMACLSSCEQNRNLSW